VAPRPDSPGVLVVGTDNPLALAVARALVGGGWSVALATPEAAATSGADDAGIERLGQEHGDEPASAAPSAALVDAATERLGRLDSLVVQAGARYRGAALDATMDDWQDDLDRIVSRAFALSQAYARRFARRLASEPGADQGAIVYLATIDAAHSYPGRFTASVAMAALEGLARTLAVEWAERAIRVNVVVHGVVLTDAEQDRIDRGDASLSRVLLRSPMGRLPSLEEIAAAVVFVASPRASFMTGQTLSVDGGWTALNQQAAGLVFP